MTIQKLSCFHMYMLIFEGEVVAITSRELSVIGGCHYNDVYGGQPTYKMLECIIFSNLLTYHVFLDIFTEALNIIDLTSYFRSMHKKLRCEDILRTAFSLQMLIRKLTQEHPILYHFAKASLVHVLL